MADPDRPFLINGHNLRIALEGQGLWFTRDGSGGHRYYGQLADAAHVAGLLLKAATPLDERRWPMARGELITRLSLALKDKGILIDREQVPGGERHYVQARNPGGLAHELVYAIDEQGDDEPEKREGPGCKCGAAECTDCYPEGDASQPDEHVQHVEADDAAVRDLKALLRGLHYETARRVLAYVSAWHAEGPEPPF